MGIGRPAPNGSYLVLALYQTFQTAYSHVNVAYLNRMLWQGFCRAIDRAELPEDDRFETNVDLVEHVAEFDGRSSLG